MQRFFFFKRNLITELMLRKDMLYCSRYHNLCWCKLDRTLCIILNTLTSAGCKRLTICFISAYNTLVLCRKKKHRTSALLASHDWCPKTTKRSLKHFLTPLSGFREHDTIQEWGGQIYILGPVVPLIALQNLRKPSENVRNDYTFRNSVCASFKILLVDKVLYMGCALQNMLS